MLTSWHTLIALFAAILVAAHLSSPLDQATLVSFPPLPSLDAFAVEAFARPQRLFMGDLIAPESFAAYTSTSFFTGTLDGRIVLVENADAPSVEDVTYKQITANVRRPLGMRYDASQGILFVCDAYLGLLAHHVSDNRTEILWRSSNALSFPNSLAVDAARRKVYFTDSSSRFPLHEHLYDVMEQSATGRLLEYDMETKNTRVLASVLPFPNGIVLTPDGRFLILASTSRAELLRFSLETGRLETLLSNLPGYPDNLSLLAGEALGISADDKPIRVLVGLAAPRLAPFEVGHFLQSVPWVRRLVAGIVPLRLLQSLARPMGLLLAVSIGNSNAAVDAGEPLAHIETVWKMNAPSASSPSEEFSFITEALPIVSSASPSAETYLYLGSFRNPFLGRAVLRSTTRQSTAK